MQLPPIIQNYVEVSNGHDVKSILACFSDDAVVSDEEETMRGKQAIKALSRPRRKQRTRGSAKAECHFIYRR
jgi:ketosteroid isomerase-like protein